MILQKQKNNVAQPVGPRWRVSLPFLRTGDFIILGLLRRRSLSGIFTSSFRLDRVYEKEQNMSRSLFAVVWKAQRVREEE